MNPKKFFSYCTMGKVAKVDRNASSGLPAQKKGNIYPFDTVDELKQATEFPNCRCYVGVSFPSFVCSVWVS